MKISVNKITIIKMPSRNQDMVLLDTDVPLQREGEESTTAEMAVMVDPGKGAAWCLENFPGVPFKYF